MGHDNSHGHESHEHGKKKYDTFFEESTIGIGFVYTVFALLVLGAIYAFG
jgi:hypothetical protein